MMRRTRFDGAFILVFLLNVLLNLRLTIPAWILLAAHFIFGVSIWWFVGAMGIFLVGILVWMLVLRGLGRVAGSSEEKPIPNKNPYSSKGYVPLAQKRSAPVKEPVGDDRADHL